MNEITDPPLNDILASIRKAVEHGPTPANLEEPVSDTPTPEPLPRAPVLPPSAEATLEQLVRSLLEPQLKAWLDAHLPEMVERLTRAEIKRLTGH